MTFIKSLLDQAMGLSLNAEFGILLYWAPVSLCAFGYTLRTFRNYQTDLEKRSAAEKKDAEPNNTSGGYYSPTDTIGDLIGRAIVTFIPVANIWAAAFDVSPILFSRLFTYLGKVFNQPLVPKRSK